jgi:hypothetical protein
MPIISGGPVSRGRENFMYPILGAFMVGSWYKVGRVTRTFFPKKRKKNWATHCESVWTNSSLLNEVKTFLISNKPYEVVSYLINIPKYRISANSFLP